MSLGEERGIWEIPLAEMSLGQERGIWDKREVFGLRIMRKMKRLQKNAGGCKNVG